VLRPVSTAPRWLRKLREWCARYLPAEFVGTISAVTSAFVAYEWTGDRGIAAITGTLAENIGFYGVMAACEWRRQHVSRGSVLRTSLRTLRVISTEFGPAEVLDSALLRPLAMYSGPFLTGEIATGSLLGKLAADAVFYALAIGSYEIVQRRARSRPRLEVETVPVVVDTVPLPASAVNGELRGSTAPYARNARASYGPRRGGRRLPGDGRGPARGRGALRHEVQRYDPDPATVELSRVSVRDRLRDRT
jgi:hypothetical protein